VHFACGRANVCSQRGDGTLPAEGTRLSSRFLASAAQLAIAETTEDLLGALCSALFSASEHIKLVQILRCPWEEQEAITPLLTLHRALSAELTGEFPSPWLGIVSRALAEQGPLVFDPLQDPDFAPLRSTLTQSAIASGIVIPFNAAEAAQRVIVVLLVDEPDYFARVGVEPFLAYTGLSGVLLNQAAVRRRLNEYATFDHLTGLLNRRALAEVLEREHVRAERYNRPYSLLFFDLDNFKSINTAYGHTVGDLALQNVARVAGRTLREGDWLGRWGGEEFLCILPDTHDSEAERIAQRVRQQVIQQPLYVNDQQVPLTLSIGVACFPQDGYDINSLLVHADAGLALAKGSGRNCVRRYTPDAG